MENVGKRAVNEANANASVSQPTINTVFEEKLHSILPRAANITKSIACLISKDLRPSSVVEN